MRKPVSINSNREMENFLTWQLGLHPDFEIAVFFMISRNSLMSRNSAQLVRRVFSNFSVFNNMC